MKRKFTIEIEMHLADGGKDECNEIVSEIMHKLAEYHADVGGEQTISIRYK